jgi:hypothetical protein
VYGLRKWSPRRLVVLAILVLLISPPLRAETGYARHWRGDEYVYRFTIRDVVQGFLLHGYFPLLPWVGFALAGFATGKRYWGDETKSRFEGWGLPLAGLGLVGLAALGSSLNSGLGREIRWYISDLTFYPASTTYVLGTLGLTLLGLWVLYRALDARQVSPGGAALAFLGRYSRFSLTTYVVHHAVHVWPLYLLAAWEGRRDPFWYYGDAVSTPAALVLAVLFIVGFYGMLVVLDRNRAYSFEGALRWLSEA